MRHAGEKLECFGYKLRLDDMTVAYTGDTEMCDEIFLLAEGADVLVMDCSYCEGEGPEHLGLEDVLEVRKRVSPRTTIVLTHLDDEPHVKPAKGYWWPATSPPSAFRRAQTSADQRRGLKTIAQKSFGV